MNCLLIAFAMMTLSHADVIFQDGFEKGELKDHWGDARFDDTTRLRLTTDAANVHSGKRSVEMTAKVGKGAGGHMVRWFLPGYDQVYVRWYVKFAEDFDQGNLMHLCALAGNRTDNKWSAAGQAGKKPTGTDFFVSNLEPWRAYGKYPPPGAMNFYTYYPDMKPDKTGPYWGNQFMPEKPFVMPRGKWVCLEMMIKVNAPGKSDGEQAFWVDGVKQGEWKGIRWRETTDLRLNSFSLDLYVHDSKRINRVWFDDVVISTSYVGPMRLSQDPIDRFNE